MVDVRLLLASGGSLVQGADRAWFSRDWLRGLTLVVVEVTKGMRLLGDRQFTCLPRREPGF